jgi:peroxiredoxin Q/BCP
VIGVSSDRQDVADRFAESLDVTFPMRGDPQGEILKAYGVRIPVLGVARRVTYVIGKDTRVRHAHESQFDAESHVVEACAFVRRR